MGCDSIVLFFKGGYCIIKVGLLCFIKGSFESIFKVYFDYFIDFLVFFKKDFERFNVVVWRWFIDKWGFIDVFF